MSKRRQELDRMCDDTRVEWARHDAFSHIAEFECMREFPLYPHELARMGEFHLHPHFLPTVDQVTQKGFNMIETLDNAIRRQRASTGKAVAKTKQLPKIVAETADEYLAVEASQKAAAEKARAVEMLADFLTDEEQRKVDLTAKAARTKDSLRDTKARLKAADGIRGRADATVEEIKAYLLEHGRHYHESDFKAAGN